MSTRSKLNKILLIILFASLILVIVFYFLKNRLPDKSKLDSNLGSSPIQNTESVPEPFNIDKKGANYQITPVQSYEMWGLVVAINNNEAWYSRFKKTDPLNTRDLCLVFGNTAMSGAYQKVKFKSQEFFCFYSYKEYQPDFSEKEVANNHFIVADSEIYKTLSQVRVGDQVHFKGYLSNYKIEKDGEIIFSRGTSLTRDDTGNGACETVYLKSFEVIKKNHPLIYYLYWVFWIIFIICFILFFIIYFWLDKNKGQNKNSQIKEKQFKQVLPPDLS